jgi:hypothetical protein
VIASGTKALANPGETATSDLLVVAVAAALLPMACLLLVAPSVIVVYVAYVLVGGQPQSWVMPVAAAVGTGIGLRLSSALTPTLPVWRRVSAAVCGLVAFAVAGDVLPFSMLDDKPFPFAAVDVLEEVTLHVGCFGSMWLAAFVALRLPWPQDLSLGRRTRR